MSDEENTNRMRDEDMARYLVLNPPIEWSDFLMTVPPGTSRGNIQSIYKIERPQYARVEQPIIKLLCDSEICGGGERFFECTGNDGTIILEWGSNSAAHCFLFYRCKHCEESSKTYALYVSSPAPTRVDIKGKPTTIFTGRCVKLGENPQFGERTPSKVISLIGGDRELFLHGRRSENHGLGIGASAYYRRVVENQKDHIFDEIIKVARRLEVNEEEIKKMEAAKADYRFTHAINDMKMFIPESLKINGRNPLTLLHAALSKDIHKKTDADCLALARSVRLILTELAERISTALQEKKEIDEAVAELLKREAED
jgi:hypothetical protein